MDCGYFQPPVIVDAVPAGSQFGDIVTDVVANYKVGVFLEIVVHTI